MGFYIRRGINVGPLRFNLSKSGIGMSVGVKGLRLGAGPRGNYIHMGRGGLYYRQTLPPMRTTTPGSGAQALPGAAFEAAAFEEIESATLSELTDASSSQLVDQIRAKARRVDITPFVLIAGMVAGVAVLAASWPAWALAAVAVPTVIGVILAVGHDAIGRKVVVLYQLDDEAQRACAAMHDAFEAVRKSANVWHVEAAMGGDHAGNEVRPSVALRRVPIEIRIGEPPLIRTNVESVLMPAGRQLLAFMPDRLMVYEGRSAAGIEYGHVQVEISAMSLVEYETVPADAKVTGSRWLHANRDGAPDRRFKNNPQLPIVVYEAIDLRSPTGLHERFLCSRPGPGVMLQTAVRELARIAREHGLESRAMPPGPATVATPGARPL